MSARIRLACATLLGAALVASAAVPHPPGARIPAVADLFRTSDRCVGCHGGVIAATGEDVSIGFDWRASMMANAARDPYWQAAVRREITDHPEERAAIEAECSRCHMPMASAQSEADGGATGVFEHLGADAGDLAPLALDGVSCALCHQITDEGLGTEESFTGGFRVDASVAWGERDVFGPFDPDAGRQRVMHSATGLRPSQADHLSTSELCATCHTLITHALGTGAGGQLPEQVPYAEWRASSLSPGRSCQSCHMPEVDGEVPVTSVLGEPRSGVSRHTFLGGNFFMLRMLSRHAAELGVTALPQELELAAARTVRQLENETATLEIVSAETLPGDGRLRVDVRVGNLTGHKLPTGYPSRRVWLHTTIRDAAGRVVFESGAPRADGSVQGNDGDADPLAFEPHHEVIERADQVQVYESVMADPQGRPTTGLLTAVRFVKDNRLLPDGFDREAASADAAVVGVDDTDADFAGGGDVVTYRVAVGGAPGPYTAEVRLLYQPIAFRWARNLAAYDAAETRRFVGWYDEMAAGSYAALSSVRARVPASP